MRYGQLDWSTAVTAGNVCQVHHGLESDCGESIHRSTPCVAEAIVDRVNERPTGGIHGTNTRCNRGIWSNRINCRSTGARTIIVTITGAVGFQLDNKCGVDAETGR